MKKLNQFVYFDWEAFAEGKVFEVTNIRPWRDFKDKHALGIVVETTIVEDHTFYECAPGEQVTNRYQPLAFKIAKNAVSVKVGDRINPIGVVATVYGKYDENLSAKVDDIIVID